MGRGKEKPGEKRLANIQAQAGHPFTLPDGKILCSSIHPAFTLRKAKHKKHVAVDMIARAGRIAQSGISWTEPPMILEPDFETVRGVLTRMIDSGAEIVEDIETAGLDINTQIRCVGFGAEFDNGDRPIIVVPRHYMDGRPYWSHERSVEIDSLICKLNDTAPLAFHNGLFDTLRLLRTGLMSDRDKTWFDTMFAHRNSRECDSEHDLGFVAGRAIDLPLWKVDVDHKLTDNVEQDHDLWKYNGLDIDGTLFARNWTRHILAIDGTENQQRIDSKLAIVLRGMTEHGLWIDEVERARLSDVLGREAADLSLQIQSLTEMPNLNPRSSHQLRDWFYRVKGYKPLLNTEAHEWAEGEDPSTSAQALIALEDAGVDRQTSEVIGKLLRFKSLDKLRSSFVDNLRTWPTDFENLTKMHPSYGIVVSGRFNSQPNVQNIPKGGIANMRKMIVAPPGHVWCGADYEQIEARIYAVEAQDSLMLEAFARGLDVHSMNAASLFFPNDVKAGYDRIMSDRKSGDPARKKDAEWKRNMSKKVAYLETFGGEGGKLGAMLKAERNKVTGERPFKDLPEKLADHFHATWHRLHPTKAWHAKVHAQLRRDGYVSESVDGRRRFFPGGPTKKNAPPNATIQPKAAAIANRAILKLVQAIPFRSWSPYTGVSIQIHDYIGAVVPEDRAREAKEIIEACMYFEEPDRRGGTMKYPAVADISKSLGDQ
jgi:DNA polymerase I-like protein with 3'-5' exonuclease and polymerase domains